MGERKKGPGLTLTLINSSGEDGGGEKKNPVYSVQNTFEEGNERRRPRHALYRETERKNTGRKEVKNK